MPTKWSDLSTEGTHLRYIHNRILKRFKKHYKEGNDELMIRAAEAICTVANTQRRIVDGIRYEHRLEEIESILMNIEPSAIAQAKLKMGV